MEIFIWIPYVPYNTHIHTNKLIYWLFTHSLSHSFNCGYAIFSLSSSLMLSTIGCMPILNCDSNTHHKHITIIIRLTEIFLLFFAEPFRAFHDGENLFEHCVYVRIVFNFFFLFCTSEMFMPNWQINFFLTCEKKTIRKKKQLYTYKVMESINYDFERYSSK